MNRRDILTCGSLSLGSMFLAGGFGTLSARAEDKTNTNAEKKEEFVWNYEELDPVVTAEKAYLLYADGSCMYATFRSIVESVGVIRATKNPDEAARWENFPFFMMTYGRGGVHDYGTLCGILNGCSAAISLFIRERKDAAAITHDLFNWYEMTELPVFVPAQSKFSEIERSIADSPLCHVSVSHWIQESGAEVESPRRKERCKRLVGDAVIHTVELLNRYFQSRQDGSVCTFAVMSEPAASCTSCHSPDGDYRDSNTRMNCSVCHEETIESYEKKEHPANGVSQDTTGK